MKNLLVSAFLLLTLPLSLFAQIPVSPIHFVAKPYEDYATDSIKYFIQGENDTLKTELYFPNGTVKEIRWRKDSIYIYSEFGDILIQKSFYKNQNRVSNPNAWVGADSIVTFYSNGQIRQTGAYTGLVQSEFYPNGRLKSYIQRFSPSILFPSQRKTNWTETGKVQNVILTDIVFRATDTLQRQIDSVFFENGRLQSVKVTTSQIQVINPQYSTILPNTDFVSRFHVFDSTGKKLSFYPPDSAALMVFKDNIDCYYGFRNGRGDTVIKPQFDFIERLGVDIYAAYRGDRCEVYRADGTRWTLPENLSYITQLTPIDQVDTISEDWLMQHDRVAYLQPNFTQNRFYYHFLVRFGDKIGVINREGAFVIPPQYQQQGQLADAKNINPYSHFTEGVNLINEQFLILSENITGNSKTKRIRKIVLNQKGQSVFGDNFQDVDYANWKNLFLVKKWDSAYQNTPPQYNDPITGLANSMGELLLDTRFRQVKSTYFQPFFVATPSNSNRQGLYNADQKRWILDTSNYQIHLPVRADTVTNDDGNGFKVVAFQWFFMTFKHCPNQKMGLLDANGSLILKAEYDSLAIIDGRNSLIWFRKDGFEGILNVSYSKIPKQTFERLIPQYGYNFFAKKNSKWGLFDIKTNAVLIPFEYDYIGTPTQQEFYHVFVKNGQTQQMLQNSSALTKGFNPQYHFRYRNKYAYQKVLKLIDAESTIFVIDTLGRIAIPPQYQLVQSHESTNFVSVFDKNGQKKLILLENDDIINFPFDYTVEISAPNCPIIVVSKTDSTFQKHRPYLTPKTYGVISKKGKILSPCTNYAIAIADAQNGIYMVQPDTPRAREIRWSPDCKDTLEEAHEQWFLYDSTGKILNKEPFSTAFMFHNGRGLGIKNQQFGIYRLDGTSITPPQYAMAWYNELAGLNVVFDRVGLKSRVLLFGQDDLNRLEKQQYDGISYFFGKYALVSAGDEVGLIDTLGNEIIPPQDLTTYTGNLLDSMFVYPKQLAKAKPDNFYYDQRYFRSLPYDFNAYRNAIRGRHLDSFSLSPSLRNAAWNLLLSIHKDNIIFGINEIRPNYVFNLATPYQDGVYGLTNCSILNDHATFGIYEISDKFISFELTKGFSRLFFYNFYHRGNRWEALTPLNFWKNTPLSNQAFYTLLVAKIRALKDADIDCGDMNSLVSRAQSQFVIGQSGVKLFLEGGQKKAYTSLKNFVTVELTWTEVQPFLNMPISN
jgi:WG containing repeat